jgi:hypothetical protein
MQSDDLLHKGLVTFSEHLEKSDIDVIGPKNMGDRES